MRLMSFTDIQLRAVFGASWAATASDCKVSTGDAPDSEACLTKLLFVVRRPWLPLLLIILGGTAVVVVLALERFKSELG